MTQSLCRHECYMSSNAGGKTPLRDSTEDLEHDNHCLGCAHCGYQDLSAPRRGRQLDLLRLGRAALFHADHHLRVRTLFRHPCGVQPRQRTGDVGLCHRGGGAGDRAVVAGAGRDCGRQRPPQAVDRRVRRAAGDRLLADVVRQARRPQRDSGAAAGLRDRHHRRRIRHRVQQRDDAVAGAAAQDRAIVRHRLGHRLCRRHHHLGARARLSGGQPRHRAHAVRIHAAVRSRSRVASGRPHHRPVHRHMVHDIRDAAVPADAGLSAETAGARRAARGPRPN